MPKHKKTSSQVQTPRPQSTLPLILAGCLLMIGIIGLVAVTRQAPETTQSSQPSDLQVIEGGNQPPQGQQSQAGQQLQQAARTQDLIQGKEGSEVQQGTNIDDLLKNKTIQ